MVETVELKVLPAVAADRERLQSQLLVKLGLSTADHLDWKIDRRSIDARQRQPVVLLRIQYSIKDALPSEPALLETLKPVHDAKQVVIVGAGPAGYFAALELIELGLKPVVIDRGSDVRKRRRDLRAIQQFGEVNPHSNYCFGEGGAGTYSDGKLYTRSHKRGNMYKALKLLVEHGAKTDILVDAHPHIGSNKLPNIVANIRETILKYGGEVHFDTYVTDFIFRKGKLVGAQSEDGREFIGESLILATGHSARDIYHLLHAKGVKIEAKPFALGVRIEHPQPLIDEIQYSQKPREEHLPASSYKLVTQVKGRGVFSFCMCPGGLVVPASTAPGELVVNGMSMSRRDSPFANSGTVVAVELEDLKAYARQGVFAGLEFQKAVEQTVFNHGDGSQKAPAQRLPDFVNKVVTKNAMDSSYIPGVYGAPLHELLPTSIYDRLQRGVQDFGKKMRGYFTSEAVVIGTESRTSSPIRIPRSPTTYMHEETEGLFPCGEGAGYAGGILSAAMDGQNVARAVAKYIG